MEVPPPSPPLRNMPPEDVVQNQPQLPAFFDNPEDHVAFEAALDRIVLRQLEQRREFLRQARNPLFPVDFLPVDVGDVLSPSNSDDEDGHRQELERRVQQQVGNFLNAQEIRREARIVLREVQARHIEVRRERQQREQNQAAGAPAAAAEINNNGNFRNFNGMLSPSPSPSPSASPIPIDDDEGVDPMAQARPDDDAINMLNVQMFGMQPQMSRPRKRHNSEGDETIKRKRVTFKEDSSDEVSTTFPWFPDDSE